MSRIRCLNPSKAFGVRSRHRTLRRVYLELEPLRDESRNALHHPLTCTLAANVAQACCPRLQDSMLLGNRAGMLADIIPASPRPAPIRPSQFSPLTEGSPLAGECGCGGTKRRRGPGFPCTSIFRRGKEGGPPELSASPRGELPDFFPE